MDRINKMPLRTSLLSLLIAAMPFALQAGNPHILIKGDPPDPAIIVSNNFTFGADDLGGGVLSFQNESGNNWFEMTVTATLPDLTAITCGPGPFVTCTVSESPVSAGFLYNIMFGPAANGGITKGQIFSINLNDEGSDPNGVGSWGPGTDFAAKANATPEPSATMLFLSGGVLITGIFSYRRRKSGTVGLAQ
jgi:hypothetical protein